MKIYGRFVLVLTCFWLFCLLNCTWIDEKKPVPLNDRVPFGAAQLVGRLEDDRLVECSGMDTSMAISNLFWAINDGGHGPFIYALGDDGRSRGRILVKGAQNRDWEALDTFFWQDRPMILIADFGDNEEQYDTHTLW